MTYIEQFTFEEIKKQLKLLLKET